jgi:hypothetical protein
VKKLIDARKVGRTAAGRTAHARQLLHQVRNAGKGSSRVGSLMPDAHDLKSGDRCTKDRFVKQPRLANAR